MKTTIEQEATTLVKQEKQDWETATVFVTDKVAFQMRELIRLCRKNYWGIFDFPTDPVTGQDKVWIPLTSSTCETLVKNIDLDTKDINFRAKKPSSIRLTALVRSAVKYYLDKMGFGEYLDEMERQLTIDGTVVWKTTETTEDGKKCIDIRMVDLLNFYIDPQAKSIQDTESVIERAVLSIDEFKKMDWPLNKELVTAQKGIERYDGDIQGTSNLNSAGETKMVEVFERWGKMSKFLITGEEKDREELIEGRIVCSATGGTWVVHLIEENKKKLKPYEEAWFTRVHGRWYGKGIAEKLLSLQEWLNTIVNIRINRARVSQLGLWKIRRTAGITSSMISRLGVNGAIMVDNMDDLEQMPMQEASQASYTDEENIQKWARQDTGAFEVATGEDLPASTTATATAIQSRSAQSQFVLIREQIGMFLQRWLKKHAIPVIFKNLKPGEILELTGEPEFIRDYDEQMVNQAIYESIEEATKQGLGVDPQQIVVEKQRVMEQLSMVGAQRFVNVDSDFNPTDYDVEVFVTNEEMDKGVLIQSLTTALQAAPEYRDQILPQLFDLMGLEPFKKTQATLQSMLPQGQPQEGQSPQAQNQPNAVDTVQQANAPAYAA